MELWGEPHEGGWPRHKSLRALRELRGRRTIEEGALMRRGDSHQNALTHFHRTIGGLTRTTQENAVDSSQSLLLAEHGGIATKVTSLN